MLLQHVIKNKVFKAHPVNGGNPAIENKYIAKAHIIVKLFKTVSLVKSNKLKTFTFHKLEIKTTINILYHLK